MKTLLIIFFSCLFAATNSIVAAATQSSINKDMFDTYEKINERTIDHEEKVEALDAQKKVIHSKIIDLKKQLDKLSQDKNKKNKEQIRLIRAEMNAQSAQYLALEFKLVTSAKNTISSNLMDINRVRERLANSPASKAQFRQLKKKMEKNIQLGRSMKKNLIVLDQWAQSDPILRAKIRSLDRIMENLDTRIEIQKRKFPMDNKGNRTNIDSRRLEALNLANDRLVEELSSIETRIDWLKLYKDKLEINLDLFRVQRTLDITNQALPRLRIGETGGGSPSGKVLNIIDDLNNGMMKDTDTIIENPSTVPKPDAGRPIKIDFKKFKNF
ncbi:MAG: hypothetical protein CMQ51_00930 [Gammaproteobacteria bacterium]|nr:hypothetical protein [Gammaproteobacteria bacterium]PPR66312.1 MAG: hypothetical protein CFH08_00026 [Alphaproteobacteria bacterium MarineAlpha3_Bin7]|tara:strand:- start:3812 stop:4792 length:981 start_codon:yes stop_codon:yes gene_type:complete